MKPREHFDQELQQLSDSIMLMASRVEEEMTIALAAYERLDPALASVVGDLDRQVNKMRFEIEGGAGVKPACLGKGFLRGAELVGQRPDDFRRDLPVANYWWELLKHGVDARLAAQAAARCAEDVARE